MKSHQYSITVTHTADKEGNPIADTTDSNITFTTNKHDEILDIVRRIQGTKLFAQDDAASFTIGLKLFGEIMLKNKDMALFTELKPHFFEFMKKLKISIKANG